MEGKKKILEALIEAMREKMIAGDGDNPLDVSEATEGATENATEDIDPAEHKEELQEILQKEEAELESGEDLDADGKAGDPKLVEEIRRYMSAKGSPTPMKAGGMMMGAKPGPSVSVSVQMKKGAKK